MIRLVLALCALFGVALAQIIPAAAQQPTNNKMRLASSTSESKAAIRAPLYYTQLEISTEGFALPAAESDKEALGKALLETLGLKKETRSIIVTLNVTAAGITYPEVPLVSYQFDGSRKLTGISQRGQHTLPLRRLDANDRFEVALTYKYSNQVVVDVNAAVGQIAALVPASTLAAAATKPFVEGVARIAGSMLGLANSRETNLTLTDEMSPHAGGKNKITVVLAKPNGSYFGTVKLTILGTPTLQRTARDVTLADSVKDFKKDEAENPATLAINVGGVRKYMSAEVKALDAFVRLAQARSDEPVANFCDTAQLHLDSQFSLTPMDTMLVVYQALTDLGFAQTNNSWYFKCFNEAERLTLKNALGLDPTLTVSAPPGSPDALPKSLKYALGCFMTGLAGGNCTANAPKPRQTLTDAMAAQVRIDAMEMTSVLSTAALPENRLIARDDLLDRLAGKAQHFGCFPRGLLLTAKDGEEAYNVEADLVEGKIVAIRIRSVPPSLFDCT